MSVRMIEQLAPQAFQAAAEDLGLVGELMADAETLFVEQARADMAKALPNLAKIYAQHYTPAELQALAVFYETPLGKKMLMVEPKILNDWEAFSRDWAKALMAKVLSRLEARPSYRIGARPS